MPPGRPANGKLLGESLRFDEGEELGESVGCPVGKMLGIREGK